MWTGVDFANNTWRAVRGLVAGHNVYAAGTWIPGVGQVGPVAEHVPATLTWQAPFAALPLHAALIAFTAASIVAIWTGVLVLSRPRTGAAIVAAAGCGAFAILVGGGPWTLLLGQPTGFTVLGIALVVRSHRLWVAALGFMVAASTIQFGLPLALALIALRQWQTVWRGAVITLACSVPPTVIGVARTGMSFVTTFAAGGIHLLGPTSNRIDLGALAHRAGVQSTAVQMCIGVSVLILTFMFLARLPAELQRMDYPPVLCLVIAMALLCTYHQPYDMLLVGAIVVPAALAGTRPVLMVVVFGIAGISAGLSGYGPVAIIMAPIGLVLIAILSAIAARHAVRPAAPDSPGPISSDLTLTSVCRLARRLPDDPHGQLGQRLP